MSGAGVKAEDLRKTFYPGTVQETRALNGIEFELAPGEFAIVIGSNGAGKSTMLNALAGEVQVDAGHLSIAGVSMDGQPSYKRASRISRVFQDPMLGTAASLTIEENLAIAARRGARRSFRAGLKPVDRAVFREALQVLGMGLEDRLPDRVSTLSGGQRQSLTLVMATLSQPDLLLLDEHTAALDPRAADLVMKATLAAVEKNREMTTIMITHNMDQALAHGDRLLMMHGGKVILNLTKAEKDKLTTADLISQFHEVMSDRMILS